MKLCANHRITPEMKLQAHGNTAKAWMWTAMDFSEDELENQVFSVKFKTSEQAGDFKIKFEEAANKKSKYKRKVLTHIASADCIELLYRAVNLFIVKPVEDIILRNSLYSVK